MTLSNYHSHSTFCDGRSSIEDFVKFAISNRFYTYGVSSHSPLPFETFWNMSKSDLPEYLREIERLKQKYEGRIELYTGMEIDYLDETYNPSTPYFQQMPLDYRIASVHFLPMTTPMEEDKMICIDGSYKEFKASVESYFDNDIRRLVERFFQSSLNMIEIGGFDIVGHVDKIYMNAEKDITFSDEATWYKDLFRQLLELIAQKGYIVEINIKNMRSKGQSFPNKKYLSWLKELQIPVMVNSDCHYPDLVNDGRKEAFDLLKSTGFTHTRELSDGKWIDIEIE